MSANGTVPALSARSLLFSVARAVTFGETSARSTCRTVCYASSMSREVTQRELRNESGKIMRELDDGETFIVTRNGIPVGELAPLRRHRFVAAETAVAVFKTAPAVDYERFRGDLDGIANQDPTPRG
jgi:antitoxin (DNA-binding transcriptional repressor) of toxin-antitoxin stability system